MKEFISADIRKVENGYTIELCVKEDKTNDDGKSYVDYDYKKFIAKDLEEVKSYIG